VFRVHLVSETAQVELRSGRVYAPAAWRQEGPKQERTRKTCRSPSICRSRTTYGSRKTCRSRQQLRWCRGPAK